MKCTDPLIVGLLYILRVFSAAVKTNFVGMFGAPSRGKYKDA